MTRLGRIILLLLVGLQRWLQVAPPVGVLGALLRLMITGALIAGALHALHASVFWGR